jgi:hypothetical protein
VIVNDSYFCYGKHFVCLEAGQTWLDLKSELSDMTIKGSPVKGVGDVYLDKAKVNNGSIIPRNLTQKVTAYVVLGVYK